MSATEEENSVTVEGDSPERMAESAEKAPSITAQTPQSCGVCKREPGKYKCPRCPMSYCSVACNRTHKENHPPETASAKQAPSSAPKPAPRDDDPYSVLLEHRSELERLFRKHPNLEDELARIHQATLPPRDDGASRGGLPWKVKIPGQAHKEPWSRDVGLRLGTAALRKARTNPGDTGDAVREYCELVLHLLSRSGRDDDATRAARQQVAAEEASTVQRLLAEEKDRG